MTMHTVFFKQHEAASINGSRWSGSDQPPAVGAYGEAFAAHSEVLSAGQNRQGLQGKGNISSTHFTLFSGECKSVENGEKTPLQTICSVQPDYRGHFELGFGQPLSCDSKYPYAEQWYGGVYSNYGTQIAGRMMLPLSVSSDGGPILVNAKQYSGIMRRRKKRAEAEAESRLLKLRKPYLHLSRHLHAMRRPRGNGGRFLNTKKSNGSKDQGGSSPLCDGGVINSSKGTNNGSSRSTSPGSEVSSQLLFSRGDNHRHASFQINHQIVHCPSFHSFEDAAANTGLGMGIGMASGGNYYLKV